MTLLANLVFSSSWWAAIGAPIANHVWQSTLFAGVAGLLTLLLRKNRAETRYSLWLTASAKFLLPCSLLIGMGSHLRWSSPPIAQPSIFVVTQVISEPFAAVNPGRAVADADGSLGIAILLALPNFLLTVWSCGCAAVLFFWWRCRRRVTAAKHDSSVVQAGRELEILRRLQQSAQMAGPIELRISESMLEPGILGIFRPVLLLPAGISDRLTDTQLEAILTHELCHVRRRDNLGTAVHMLVEAIFWFHPLVWWMGTRLVDERERACDEEVLKRGGDPQAYAEGILKVCEFYLESPLYCAAGVTSSNLKKRIEAIMTNRVARNLELGKKLLLAAVGVAVVVGPVVFGLLHAAQSRAQAAAQNVPAVTLAFETLSMKPNKTGESMAGLPISAIRFTPKRFMATNVTLQGLIKAAYAVQDSQILGGPDWLNSEKYDLDAKIDGSALDQLRKLSKREARFEWGLMLQALLADRFKLALHRETRPVQGYALLIADHGPKLQQAKPGDTYPNGFKDPQGRPLGAPILLKPGPCKLLGQGVLIADLVQALSRELSAIVVDETGLKGNFDFTLDCHAAFMERGGSLLTVLPEQLGLDLKAQTVPAEVLVIDHAEKITGNESSQTQPQDQSVAESVAASIPPAGVYNAVSIFKSVPNPMPTWDLTPDGFTATNVTLQNLIQWAYGVEGFQIYGAPNWLGLERYDLKAKVDNSVANDMRSLTKEQLKSKQQPMLLELLADLFKLEVHRETRELPVYELVVEGNGAKLQQATVGEPPQMRFGKGLIAGQAEPIGLAQNGRPSLVRMLSLELQRPVLDKTGLKGIYDFSLEWTPDDRLGVEHGPSLFVAIQEQLGLKLLPSNEQTAPVQVLVVDHAERVTSNEEVNAAHLN